MVGVIASDLQALPLSRFKHLERFEVRRSWPPEGDGSVSLRIFLRTERSATGARLELMFSGVRGLDVGAIGEDGCLQLEVRDARGDQLEGIGYRVVEAENDMLAFWCQHLSFTLVEAGL